MKIQIDNWTSIRTFLIIVLITAMVLLLILSRAFGQTDLEVTFSNITAIGAETPEEEKKMIDLGIQFYEEEACGGGWQCEINITKIDQQGLGQNQSYIGNLSINGIINVSKQRDQLKGEDSINE
jgi:hypothetical protein